MSKYIPTAKFNNEVVPMKPWQVQMREFQTFNELLVAKNLRLEKENEQFRRILMVSSFLLILQLGWTIAHFYLGK